MQQKSYRRALKTHHYASTDNPGLSEQVKRKLSEKANEARRCSAGVMLAHPFLKNPMKGQADSYTDSLAYFYRALSEEHFLFMLQDKEMSFAMNSAFRPPAGLRGEEYLDYHLKIYSHNGSIQLHKPVREGGGISFETPYPQGVAARLYEFFKSHSEFIVAGIGRAVATAASEAGRILSELGLRAEVEIFDMLWHQKDK